MNRRIVSPHDRFFKLAMSQQQVAKEFFDYHLPARIRQTVDLETLSLRKESYVDEELKLAVTDVLFTVDFAQQHGYLYLLAEHQSKPDRWMPFRLLKYLVRIMEQHIKETDDTHLPLIFPLVFYHGQTPYPYSTDLLTLFDDPLGLAKMILFRPFHLVDVGQVADESLRQHVWASVLQLCMKHVFARDILPFLQALVPVLRQVEQMGGQTYVTGALTYLLTTAQIPDTKQFVATIQEGLSPEVGEHMMTIAEQFKAEGEAIGLVKGMTAGQLAAQKNIARKLLEKGMGVKAVSQLTELPLTEVQALAEALTQSQH